MADCKRSRVALPEQADHGNFPGAAAQLLEILFGPGCPA